MKLNAGVLFSGGKDSVYSMHLAYISGFDIKVIIILVPPSNSSMMFHHPYVDNVNYEEILSIPIVKYRISDEKKELDVLKEAIRNAKEKYDINYIITGAIASDYQRMRINFVCEDLGLKVYSPLWHKDQLKILKEQIDLLKINVVSITSMGLNKNLLLHPIGEDDYIMIKDNKILTNKAFEGGEAETLVLDAPMYKKRIKLLDRNVFSFGEFEHYLKANIILEDKN